jgi:hypothetical protein
MQADQADKMEAFFSGPAGMAIVVGQQAIGVPLFTLFAAPRRARIDLPGTR